MSFGSFFFAPPFFNNQCYFGLAQNGAWETAGGGSVGASRVSGWVWCVGWVQGVVITTFTRVCAFLRVRRTCAHPQPIGLSAFIFFLLFPFPRVLLHLRNARARLAPLRTPRPQPGAPQPQPAQLSAPQGAEQQARGSPLGAGGGRSGPAPARSRRRIGRCY